MTRKHIPVMTAQYGLMPLSLLNILVLLWRRSGSKMPEWKLTPRMESPTKPPIKNNHEIKKDEEINNKYDSASAKLRYSIIASSAGLILAFYGLMEKELSLVFSGLSFYSLGRMG